MARGLRFASGAAMSYTALVAAALVSAGDDQAWTGLGAAVMGTLWVVFAVLAVWVLGAARAAWRGTPWGRPALLVTFAVATVVSAGALVDTTMRVAKGTAPVWHLGFPLALTALAVSVVGGAGKAPRASSG